MEQRISKLTYYVYGLLFQSSFFKIRGIDCPLPRPPLRGETDTEEVTVYVNGTAAEQKQPNKSDYICIT